MPEIEGHAVPDPNVYVPGDDNGWADDVFGTSEGGSFFDRIGEVASQLGDAAKHSAGPGFAYSHDQLISLGKKWQQLAEDFKRDRDTAYWLGQTQPPGLEYASKNNAKSIRDAGTALYDTLGARSGYCAAQATKFEKAAGIYAENEDAAASEVNQHDGGIV